MSLHTQQKIRLYKVVTRLFTIYHVVQGHDKSFTMYQVVQGRDKIAKLYIYSVVHVAIATYVKIIMALLWSWHSLSKHNLLMYAILEVEV